MKSFHVALTCVDLQLEDDNYKPVDPKAMRLPPPCPPTDRLLQAVEAFYAQPSHERPRDRYSLRNVKLNYGYFNLGIFLIRLLLDGKSKLQTSVKV